MNNMKKAFTIAEVLITLGIIGIVASMTIPQLIKNYQSKVCETAFKKSYSNLSKAYLMTKNELGVSNLRKAFAVYDEVANKYPDAPLFINTFLEQLGVESKAKIYLVTNYNRSKSKKTVNSQNGFGNVHIMRILNDGSGIGMTISGAQIYFYVDTNGYAKPNRLGFDIFVFKVSKQDAIEPVKMSKLYTEEELEGSSISRYCRASLFDKI